MRLPSLLLVCFKHGRCGRMDITYVGCVSDVERMFAGEWCASHGSYYIYVAFGFAFSFRAFQRWVGRLTGPRNCLDIGLRL